MPPKDLLCFMISWEVRNQQWNKIVNRQGKVRVPSGGNAMNYARLTAVESILLRARRGLRSNAHDRTWPCGSLIYLTVTATMHCTVLNVDRSPFVNPAFAASWYAVFRWNTVSISLFQGKFLAVTRMSEF